MIQAPSQAVEAPVKRPRGGALGYVRRLTKASGSSFYYAFLTLPRARRDAIIAVYAFCRVVDDAADEAPGPVEAAAALAWWQDELSRAMAGRATHPVAQQAALAARRFDLPEQLFREVLRGVEMDLSPRRFADFPELAGYCDLVAGAVGRLCVRIFGRSDAEADRYAAELGLALQLTNILRDLGPDARQGRCYLPLDGLARHHLDEQKAVFGGGPQRAAMLQELAAEARRQLASAARRVAGNRRTFCAAEVMRVIYTDLLDRLERAGFPADRTVRVPRGVKAWLALRVWGLGR